MTATESPWLTLIRHQDLIDNHPTAMEIDGIPIVVIRCDQTVHALAGLCSHEHARLTEGRISDGRLHCPRHQASFALSDGSPDPGWQIPALCTYPVRIMAGVVQIDRRRLRPSRPIQRWDRTR